MARSPAHCSIVQRIVKTLPRTESLQLNRDRFLAPVVAGAVFFGATLAIFGPVILRFVIGHYP